MAGGAAHRKYTIREHLRLEQYSNVRHEYLDGQIYAMAGGTPEHGLSAANVIALLVVALRGRPCRVHTSDVRIRVVRSGLDTYPDVSVVRGRETRDEEDRDAIVNPLVLVEALSPSTEDYDRGEKLEHYKTIESLGEVLFVAHGERLLEVVRREEGGWITEQARSGERMALRSLRVELDVDEVYRDALAS